MTPDLLLVHREGSRRFSALENVDHFSFTTCLRHIVICDPEAMGSFDEIDATDDLLRGDEAYRFLLEVICGLRSPLIGETEVYGQFKNAAAAFAVPATPWGSSLARTFKNLFEDAKRIRSAHLEDLGSQSYGSVVRREVKGLSRVHLLGAGHLVGEILPWIAKDGIQVTIHCRDIEKAARELGAIAEKVHLATLDQQVELASCEALVIAAPVPAAWISSWMPTGAAPAIVLDLRSNADDDALQGFARIVGLGDILSRLTSNETLLQERKRAALDAVEAATESRARHVEYRPFGWEDVCA